MHVLARSCIRTFSHDHHDATLNAGNQCLVTGAWRWNSRPLQGFKEG